MNIRNKQINIFTGVIIGAMLFMCMSTTIVGPLLSDIMKYYNLRLDSGSLMYMYQNIGGTAAIILISFIMDKLNKTVAFIVPMFFFGVCLLLIGIAPSYTVFMLVFLFFGISASTMDMNGNTIVAEIQQENRNTALTLLQGIASLGAVAAPFVASGLTQAGLPWETVYTVLGIVTLFALLIYILTAIYVRKSVSALKADRIGPVEKGAFKRFFSDKRVWVAILCAFTFGGYQSGISVWVAQYFVQDFGSGELAAGLGLTVFWLGMSCSRLVLGLTPLRKLETRPLAIFGSIPSGILLVIGMLIHNYTVMLALIFISGVLSAPLLPRTVGLVNGWYRNNSGLASSAVFGAMYLAFAFFPMIMGTMAYAWGIPMLMLVPATAAILAGVIAILLPKKKPAKA